MDYSTMKPSEVRSLIRQGKITCQTSGMCESYAQGNLLILPRAQAYDFLLFTQRNPKSCPILEVGDVGSRFVKKWRRVPTSPPTFLSTGCGKTAL